MTYTLPFFYFDTLMQHIPKDISKIIHNYYNISCKVCKEDMTLCKYCDDYYCISNLCKDKLMKCSGCGIIIHRDRYVPLNVCEYPFYHICSCHYYKVLCMNCYYRNC
jgi:hypothetical protein